jgi:hypothetical protein
VSLSLLLRFIATSLTLSRTLSLSCGLVALCPRYSLRYGRP